MSLPRTNIVLIGMPGSGKSTVGVILAKRTARAFVDTDLLIQTSAGRPLQEIVDAGGPLALRRIEEGVLLGLACENHVVATGGSAVYSRPAMAHLRSRGTIVYLKVDLPTLEGRVLDFDTRGIAREPGQSLRDLLKERAPLYQSHADLVVTCRGLSQEQVCARIADAVRHSAAG